MRTNVLDHVFLHLGSEQRINHSLGLDFDGWRLDTDECLIRSWNKIVVKNVGNNANLIIFVARFLRHCLSCLSDLYHGLLVKRFDAIIDDHWLLEGTDLWHWFDKDLVVDNSIESLVKHFDRWKVVLSTFFL